MYGRAKETCESVIIQHLPLFSALRIFRASHIRPPRSPVAQAFLLPLATANGCDPCETTRVKRTLAIYINVSAPRGKRHGHLKQTIWTCA